MRNLKPARPVSWRKRYKPRHENTTPYKSGALDIWLFRLSQIAQFGLLLIATGSLYFTVIPLYQKAALEEAIARKEKDLQDINSVLSDAYIRLRSFTMRDFKWHAVHDCTTLWRQPPLPNPTEASSISHKDHYESAFDLNTRECLSGLVSDPRITSELNTDDKEELTRLVESASDRIDISRNSAAARFKKASITITQEKADSMELKGLRADLLQWRSTWLGEHISTERLKLAISLEKEQSAIEFEDTVRAEIMEIKLSDQHNQNTNVHLPIQH